MTTTERLAHRFSSFARRRRAGRGPSRTTMPRHEAFALGLGCDRSRPAARAEWR